MRLKSSLVAKNDHVSDLLQHLGRLTANELFQYHTMCLIHKVRRTGDPKTLADNLIMISETRDRNTRQNNNLQVYRCPTQKWPEAF